MIELPRQFVEEVTGHAVEDIDMRVLREPKNELSYNLRSNKMSNNDQGWILRPCPFCYGPPCMDVTDAITSRRVGAFRDLDDDADLSEGVMVDVKIWCHECGATGPSVDGLVFGADEIHDLQHQAAALWNTTNARHISLYQCQVRVYWPWPNGWTDSDGAEYRPPIKEAKKSCDNHDFGPLVYFGEHPRMARRQCLNCGHQQVGRAPFEDL